MSGRLPTPRTDLISGKAANTLLHAAIGTGSRPIVAHLGLVVTLGTVVGITDGTGDTVRDFCIVVRCNGCGIGVGVAVRKEAEGTTLGVVVIFGTGLDEVMTGLGFDDVVAGLVVTGDGAESLTTGRTVFNCGVKVV